MHEAKRITWALVGWWAFLTSTLVQGVGILLSALWPWDPERRFALSALRFCWGSLNMWLNPIWSVEHQGLEHIGDGPYIVVSNHQSVCDIPSIVGLPLPIRLVAREGIARVPIMGRFLRMGGHLVAGEGVLDAGRRTLGSGLSMLIFAEGSRSEDGRIRRFRGGAFHLAKDTGAAILPVVTEGGRFIVPKGDWRPTRWPVRVKVRVLPPVSPEDFDSPVALKKHVHQRMLAAKETL